MSQRFVQRADSLVKMKKTLKKKLHTNKISTGETISLPADLPEDDHLRHSLAF
jgi:hypothetical protein